MTTSRPPVTLHGAGGNDRLHGGSSVGGPMEVLGEAGNDTISTALNSGPGVCSTAAPATT